MRDYGANPEYSYITIMSLFGLLAVYRVQRIVNIEHTILQDLIVFAPNSIRSYCEAC